MISHYEMDDVKKLAKLAELKPDLMEALDSLQKKVFTEGALSVKMKELMAVACAHVTRCPFCIEHHTKLAKEAGATEQEIAEAIFVAITMSAGASFAHSVISLKALGH